MGPTRATILRRSLGRGAVQAALAACLFLSSCSTRTARPATAADPVALSSAAEDAPCAADADCDLTWVAKGACCPLLCAPRAVTRARAAELAAAASHCGTGKPCPQPSCMPQRSRPRAACAEGRCTLRSQPDAGSPRD